MTEGKPDEKTTTVDKIDVDKDGKLDTVTTTVTKRDTDKDGNIDIVETEVVAVDDDGNVLQTSINIDAENLDVNASAEINLTAASRESQLLLSEISELQSKISCSKVQHMGSMSDYSELFKKAQEYINQVGDKNINLVIDTSVLEKFANEAKIYSEMFNEVELKFSRLSTVDDTELLKKIKGHMAQIALMYENIQKFHATITTTSILQIPDSIKTVTESITAVTESIECSMDYLEFFADATKELTEEQRARAELSEKDKSAIVAAIRSLDLWLDLINNEANVTMSGNAYVQAFKDKISKFDDYYNRLHSVVSKVADRMEKWRAGIF